MKGFGIYVKNDLLEAKHIDQMGAAIWLYLWCLDCMTSITEDGIGNVLGGKVLTFDTLGGELGITHSRARTWLERLRKHGYIHTKRTPQGFVLTVSKAKKVFGKRVSENTQSDSQKNDTQSVKKPAIYIDKTISNKDKTIKTSSKEEAAPQEYGNLQVNQVMVAFALMGYEPTPKTVQRRYATTLIKNKGFEEVVAKLKEYRAYRGDQFCPVITSPKELWYKWDKLKTHAARKSVTSAKEEQTRKAFFKEAA